MINIIADVVVLLPQLKVLPMAKARVHLIIHGYVQGVFYRASTCETARRLGLKGWVKNLPDGNVEALFEGDTVKLNEMIQWCRSGPAGAHVTDVAEKWQDFKGEFTEFSIAHTF